MGTRLTAVCSALTPTAQLKELQCGTHFPEQGVPRRNHHKSTNALDYHLKLTAKSRTSRLTGPHPASLLSTATILGSMPACSSHWARLVMPLCVAVRAVGVVCARPCCDRAVCATRNVGTLRGRVRVCRGARKCSWVEMNPLNILDG